MRFRSLSFAFRLPTLAFSLTLPLLFAACTSEADEVAKAEREALAKAKNVLTDVMTKTDAALKKGGFEKQTLFYRYEMKRLSDAARAVEADAIRKALPAAKVEVIKEKDQERTMKVVVPRKDTVATFEVLKDVAAPLWATKVVLTKESAEIELTTWPGTDASLGRAREGQTPKFQDIQLWIDLKAYRVSPKHTPQPANAALFGEVKSLFESLEKKQNELLKQGHSQGVAVLAQTVATFSEGTARVSAFAAEIALIEKAPALFASATLEPGLNEIRIEGQLADSTKIEDARKRARQAERVLRGDPPAAKDGVGQYSWDRTTKLKIKDVPKDFALPDGFSFEPAGATAK